MNKEENEGVILYGLKGAEKAKRKDFVRLVNQLMLKLETARIMAGEQYVNEDVLCNPLFKHYGERKRERIGNDGKHINIGLVKDIFYYNDSLEYQENEKMFVEDLGNNNCRIVLENEYNPFDSLGYFCNEIFSDIITIDELQKFCDSICQYCSYFSEATIDLTEKMIQNKEYFDDNRFIL